VDKKKETDKEEKEKEKEEPSIWDKADSWAEPETPHSNTRNAQQLASKTPQKQTVKKTKEEAKKELDDILKPRVAQKELFEEEEDPLKKAETIQFKVQQTTKVETQKKPTETCFKCNQELGNKLMNAMGHNWHPECFVCFACQKPFKNSQYTVFEAEAFCDESCVEASVCDQCQKLIKSEFVTANEKRYHLGCFTCEVCSVPFPNGEYTLQEGVAVCKNCLSSGEPNIEFSGVTAEDILPDEEDGDGVKDE